MNAKTALSALAAATFGLTGSAAFAADPEAGEQQWRQCRACHMIAPPEGDAIQNGGRVGPNLYGVIGRQAGTVEGFRYSDALVQAGEDGLVWDEESFVEYVQNPTAFIRDVTGDSSARSPMNFQMRSGAEDMYAYLESLNGE
ncbi:MAG: cytochrome c [Rhodobacteraceae bacterium HLUCCA12]|nr:MAG: cytochrome c [Rhodobacteraceae bacterium HLUCCA12]